MATAVKEIRAAASEFQTVPINLIQVDKGFNNRRALGDLSELAASIKSVGLLQPLLVTRRVIPGAVTEPRGYLHLIAGHRRLAASKLAGKTHVDVKIVDKDQQGRLESLLVENLHRLDIDPLEEADGYQRLTVFGLSQKEIAAKVGRSPAHISKRLALIGLAPEAIKLLNSGGIPIDKAIDLAKLEPELQAQVLKQEQSHQYGERELFRYSSPSRVAQEILQKRQLEQRRKDSTAAAKKAGVQLLKGGPFSEWSWNSRSERPLGKGHDQVALGVKEHRALPCHRAYVTVTGYLAYACADPAAHMSKKDAAAFKARAVRGQHDSYAVQEQKRKARQLELNAIKETREAFLLTVLPKLDRSTSTEFVLESLVRLQSGNYDGVGPATVLRLLGQPSTDAGQVARLFAYCNKSDANLMRASVVISYLEGMAALNREQTYSPHGPQFIATLTWLKSLGYAPADAEAAFETLVTRGRRREDPDDGDRGPDDDEDDA